jgi:cobalt/nickel transport system ATP-binding protein
VLACEPNLLALDEPSSNLDPRSRRRLIDILQGLPAAQIIASHDLELILELCERVIVLDQGRIQADGPAREVLADPALMLAHGLEVPLSIQYGLEVGHRKVAAP